MSGWTRTFEGLPALQIVASHDFEQARMIGQPQLLRRARDVPIVAIEGGDNNLSLRLGLPLLKCPGASRGGFALPQFKRNMIDSDPVGPGCNDHPFDDISEFAHVVAPPIMFHQNLFCFGINALRSNSEAGTCLGEKMLDQFRNIRLAIT